MIILRCVLSADEFHEASESPFDVAATTAESLAEPGETNNDTSDTARSEFTDNYSALLGDSVTADSGDSLQLCENAVIDVRIIDNNTENAAAEVGEHDDGIIASTEDNRMSQVDCSEQTNSDTQSHLGTDLPADGVQCNSKDDVSGDECPSQLTNSLSADDTVHSQQLDTTDGCMPADGSNTQSETKETFVDDFSQLGDNQLADGTHHLQELDKVSLGNCQETRCTSAPLHLVEELSTADSNDDAAEFVEASASLNPELCADVQQIADGEIQPTETATDVDLQQLEDGDDDSKDDEQFVDSATDISPPQPVEGNVGMKLL